MTDEQLGAAIRADAYWVRNALIEAEFQFRKQQLGGKAMRTPVTHLLGLDFGSASSWCPTKEEKRQLGRAEGL